MVNLTRIYTRTGDAGETRLSDNSVARKTDARVAAYGDVDEANSVLGIALATGALPDALESALRFIQNELFDVGADLSTPVTADPPWPPLRIQESSVERLERWCDEFSGSLSDLRSFILPGGSPAAAHLHLARTVVRRAERAGWLAAETHGLADAAEPVEGGVNPVALRYLNRLSDLLFIASRVANGPTGDVLWVPGADRTPPDERARRARERIVAARSETAAPATPPPSS